MDVGKERLSLGSLALIKRCSRTKEPGISHRAGEAFNDIFLLFFATSTAVVLHKHTHTHTEGFSSASLFVANGGGGKKRGRANCGGCANSMRCIFNPNARFFSSFQCLNSSACHTLFSFRRPALHMQTFMMTLKRGRWALGGGRRRGRGRCGSHKGSPQPTQLLFPPRRHVCLCRVQAA